MHPQANEIKPVALTIAGFDPSGGAGVLADIRTFNAFALFPVAAITSVTFQNQTAVFGAEHLSPASVRQQVMAISAEHKIACAKTGMLPTREIVREVARLFRETDLPSPVIDPVLSSTSGYSLVEEGALQALLQELLPLARLVTPNIPEAERITGMQIRDESGMLAAAQAIRDLGAQAVLIKGGHLHEKSRGGESPTVTVEALDVLDEGGIVTTFRSPWIFDGNLRGTGCILSAAIAACLAKGMKLDHAIREAKQFVSAAISGAVA